MRSVITSMNVVLTIGWVLSLNFSRSPWSKNSSATRLAKRCCCSQGLAIALTSQAVISMPQSTEKKAHFNHQVNCGCQKSCEVITPTLKWWPSANAEMAKRSLHSRLHSIKKATFRIASLLFLASSPIKGRCIKLQFSQIGIENGLLLK